MADIVLKNASGEDVTYSGVDLVQLANTDGGTTEFVDKALLGDIPTKTSQLENDSGFITAEDIPASGGASDAADVSYLPSTESETPIGQNTVKAVLDGLVNRFGSKTDVESLKTKVDNLTPGSGGSSGPVSWNDLTDKPFYESGPVLTEVLPSTDVPFTLDGGMYMFMNTATEEQATAWESDWETAIVTWNGVEYTCQPQIVDGIKAIGNLGLMMGTGDSGEPFIFGFGRDGTIPMVICRDVATAPAEGAVDGDTITNTIRIQLNMVEIHQLDEKFVPELDYESKIKNKPFGTTPAGTVIAEGNMTCGTVSETDSDGNPTGYYGTIDEIDLVPGGSYQSTMSMTVAGEVQSMTMTGTAVDYGGIVALELQSGGTTISMLVNGSIAGQTLVIVNNTEPVTFDYQLIVASDIIKKIDEQYLPEISGLPAVTTTDNNKVLTVVNGVWAAQTPATGLPTVSTSDNGKFLQVSNGAWAAVSLTDVSQEGA